MRLNILFRMEIVMLFCVKEVLGRLKQLQEIRLTLRQWR